jgi:hypothetical protein
MKSSISRSAAWLFTTRKLQQRRTRVATEGRADLVDVHDSPSDAVAKAIPSGVYDLAANEASSASAQRYLRMEKR